MDFKKFSAGSHCYGKWEGWAGGGGHEKKPHVNFNDNKAFETLEDPLSENYKAVFRLREAIGVC
jgi:hypothetical protein